MGNKELTELLKDKKFRGYVEKTYERRKKEIEGIHYEQIPDFLVKGSYEIAGNYYAVDSTNAKVFGRLDKSLSSLDVLSVKLKRFFLDDTSNPRIERSIEKKTFLSDPARDLIIKLDELYLFDNENNYYQKFDEVPKVFDTENGREYMNIENKLEKQTNRTLYSVLWLLPSIPVVFLSIPLGIATSGLVTLNILYQNNKHHSLISERQKIKTIPYEKTMDFLKETYL